MFYASCADFKSCVEAFAAAGIKLDASGQADLAVLRTKADRMQREDEARRAAQDRQLLLLNLAIKVPLFLLWGPYLVAAIVWRENTTMWNLDLMAGPILGGAGAGLVAGFWFTRTFSSGHGGIPAIANGVSVGAAVALVTLVTLAILGWRGRADMAAHPWFYYVGTALSLGIPAAISILSFGR